MGIRVTDWPKPTQKKWRVCEPVVRDCAGNICINPSDKTGRMYVSPLLVEIVES
jgi:hypothetical protein